MLHSHASPLSCPPLSGFLLAKIPVYFIWINKSSFLTYAYAGLMQSELQGLQVRRRRRGAVGLMQSELQGLQVRNGIALHP